MSEGQKEGERGNGGKRLVIGSDRSGRHRGEIKGGERRHGWRDGEGTERMRYGWMGRGRGGTYLSLRNPPDSSQRQLQSEGEREREKER